MIAKTFINNKKQVLAKIAGPSVAIFGQELAALSAATELMKRGFQVRLYQRTELTKVCQQHYFIPSYYKNFLNTITNIPTLSSDLLSECSYFSLFSDSKIEKRITFHIPRQFENINQVISTWFSGPCLELSPSEIKYFQDKVSNFIKTCSKRRTEFFEKITWAQYLDSENQSEQFNKCFTDGLSYFLINSDPRLTSASVVGNTLIQLLVDATQSANKKTSILNGPIQNVLYTPWKDYLRANGVEFISNCRIVDLSITKKKISSATVCTNKKYSQISADYFIIADQVNTLAQIINPDFIKKEVSLKTSELLKENWIASFNFEIEANTSLPNGPIIFFEHPWKMTLLNTSAYWDKKYLPSHRTTISIEIKNWNTKGYLHNKIAQESSLEEIIEEIKSYLKIQFNQLTDSSFFSSTVSPGLKFFSDGTVTHSAPSIAQDSNNYDKRPRTTTEFSNLFIAGEFTQTKYKATSLESAAESAKTAVNALLKASKTPIKMCKILAPREPSKHGPSKLRDWVKLELELAGINKT